MRRGDALDCLLGAKRREGRHFARLIRRRKLRCAVLRREIDEARRQNWREWVCGWVHRVLGV